MSVVFVMDLVQKNIMIVMEIEMPTILLPLPTVTDPDPGEPQGGSSQEQEQQGQTEQQDTRELPEELPMAPFDAATSVEFTIPIIEQPVEIPVPKPEVVITAGTTAFVATTAATGAAVFAKPLFDQVIRIMKPLMKKILSKLMGKKPKVFGKSEPLELPDQLRFEGSRLSPALLCQHRDQRKEKKDGKKPPA